MKLIAEAWRCRFLENKARGKSEVKGVRVEYKTVGSGLERGSGLAFCMSDFLWLIIATEIAPLKG